MSDSSSSSELLPTERRFERRLEEARECLPQEVRGQEGEDDPQRLSEQLARQLAALPPEQRRAIRHRIAVAVNDLEGLIGELEQDLAGLADDLRALNRHGGAAQAYAKVGGHDRSS